MIDYYFPKCKVAVEVDELGHKDRDQTKENKKQKDLEQYLDCKFIRINPDEKDFSAYDGIGKIQAFIDMSKEEKIQEHKEETKEHKKQKKEHRKEIKELEDKINEKEKESNKKIKEVESKIKEEQKSKFEKELLSYVSSISIPVKPIKYFVKKILPTL